MSVPLVSSPERGSNGRAGSPDPLATLQGELKRQKQRYTPFGITDYIKGVWEGKYPHPPRNAAALLVDALTTTQPIRAQGGYLDYPVFTNRSDELAMWGIPRSIERYMRAHQGEAKSGAGERMVVVVAPTGAGKSTLNQVPVFELERYTDSMDPAPVYGIEDCPINEEPLHVLDAKTREIWRGEKGIDVTGNLCPDCQLRAEERIQGNTTGYQTGEPLPLGFKVQALRFSQDLGRGITTIEPRTFMQRNAHQIIDNAVLGSNRGMLRIKEFGQIAPDFIRALNDLIRGRRYSVDGKNYKLDNVIIAEMTTEEWEKLLENTANQSLVERMDVIETTYPLDPESELRILQKRITASRLDTPPHFSPRALESVALGAVRTRLEEYDRPAENGKPAVNLDAGEKALFYSGKNINGLTQMDRRAVEEAGRNEGEGTRGISPPAVWNVVSKLMSEQITRAEQEGERGCVDFVELHKRLADFVEISSALSIEDVKRFGYEFEAVETDYNQWLLNTLERAFQDRYSERANMALTDYLNEIELILDPKNKVKIDPITKSEIEPDFEMVEHFEDYVNGHAFSRRTDQGQEARKGFRRQLYSHAGNVKKRKDQDPKIKNEDKEPVYTDFFDVFPGFEIGMKNYLKGQGLEDPKDILKALTPTTEQAKKLDEVKERLKSPEYDFCEHCTPKLMTYLGRLLREGMV